MTNGLIYKISNTVNDKIYIGQTIQQLSRRWQKHISDSKEKDTHLYRAMRLYGVDKFSIEIVEDNIPQEELSDKEKYYISQYNSFNDGYNSTPGGESGMVGQKVYQYDLNGNFIKEYQGSNEAERETGCLHQNILKTCKGIFSQTGGYYWSFEKFDKISVPKNKKFKPVARLDENNKIVEVYSSVKEVATSLNVESTHVSRAIRRGYRLHGSHYVYLDGNENVIYYPDSFEVLS